MTQRLIRTTGPLSAVVRPPGSKSITNRALVCAALAEGESFLSGALDSDDTRVMVDSLRRLGLAVDVDLSAKTIRLVGSGGVWPASSADLFVGNSGTTIRFLTAMVAIGAGVYRLDGVARMRQRPIGDLLDSLVQLGVDAISEAGNGCPPVLVRAAGLPGGPTKVRGNVSSQFLSGLLMAAPYARREMEIEVDGQLVSVPYVRMTLDVMRAFGVEVVANDLSRFRVPSGKRYGGREYEIEPDASAASYFWGAAAITGGRITVAGLSRDALQGDVGFCDCLAKMGCRVEYGEREITVIGGPLRGIDVDMNSISDTAQTLAAVALFADGPTTIRGVGHNRHKETDRISDLARELRKFGATVDEFEDGFRVIPPLAAFGQASGLSGAEIDTYDDHRMAMSMAIVGLKVPNVVIRNPECTAKTYPEFFEDLDSLSRP